MKTIWGTIAVLLIILIYLDYRNFCAEDLVLTTRLGSPVEDHSIHSLSMRDGKAAISFDGVNDAFIAVPLQMRTHFWRHLQLDYEQAEGVGKVEIFYRLDRDPGFRPEQKLTPRKVKNEAGTFTWYLPPGDYQQLRVDLVGSRTGNIVLKDLKLYEFSYFFRGEAYFYLLAMVFLVMFILPGSAIFVLCCRRLDEAPKDNLLFFFCNSLLFYLLLYLVLAASLELDLQPTSSVTRAFVAGLVILAVGLTVRHRWSALGRMFRAEKQAYIASVLLLAICSLFITRFSLSPFEIASVNHNSLDKEVIFSSFGGHDNKFQFINGKAIADDEPFSKYYGGGKLTYQVQDRGILAGVVYAVFRTLISTWSEYIGQSYLTFTLIGLCMNLMVIFPLAVLSRRYFPPAYQSVILLILCLNTYVLPNFYFTWFKFAGAALFLSGLLVMLERRGSLGAWSFAGLSFGLASSMHAGNALSYPFVFIWLVIWNIKDYGLLCRKVLLYPVVLLVIFVLVNLPWSVVKAICFPDRHALIRQHYLPGAEGNSLFESIVDFYKAHPLKEQLRTRLNHFVVALRFERWIICFQLLQEGKIKKFVQVFNNWQFFLVIFSLGPLFCIALTARLFSGIRKLIFKAKETSVVLLEGSSGEMRTLLLVSCMTLLALIFMHYGEFPDINHQQAPGTTLIIHSLLIGVILKSGRTGQLMLALYALFSFWRLYTYSMWFIFV